MFYHYFAITLQIQVIVLFVKIYLLGVRLTPGFFHTKYYWHVRGYWSY